MKLIKFPELPDLPDDPNIPLWTWRDLQEMRIGIYGDLVKRIAPILQEAMSQEARAQLTAIHMDLLGTLEEEKEEENTL